MLLETLQVLLVEDDHECAMLVTTAAEMARVPFSFTFVSNGLEAVDYLFRQGSYIGAPRPDLVILDLNLPILNGTEVLKQIERQPDLRAIPLVLLTTTSSHETIKKEFLLSDQCCYTKPDRFLGYVQLVQRLHSLFLAGDLDRVKTMASL